MSNINPDSVQDQLSGAFRFALNQFKKSLSTAIPALIIEYDQATKRAVVQTAINVVMTDRSEARRPPIVDVPIIWPSSGGYIMHAPLRRDDAVMLLVSERGLTEFKRLYAQSSPVDDIGVMQYRDAVGIPGFGDHEPIQVPEPNAMTVQTEDGQQRISVNQNGDIRVRSTRLIRLDAPRVEINGDNNVVVTGARIDLN